ncbi:hypothetical protein GW17_00004191 [Ensete ventricosum]|nr:hypothetical protein GW17_00004191 [Ensete ventricosum]
MVEEPTKAGFAGGGDREGEDEQVVNPWEVTAKDGGKIDYDKLIEKFGCQRLDESLVRRVERLTGRPAHVFLRRGVFFAHRSEESPAGDGSRGRIGEEQCTGNMFLPLLLLPLLLSLSIDRRRSILEVSPSSGWSAYRSAGKPVCIARYGALSLGKANLGLGSIAFYENMVKVAKCVTFNKIFLPYLNIIYCLQAVPSFPSSFPHLFSGKDNLRCLIPCAIDQVDIPVKYLGFFLEDDAELDHIKKVVDAFMAVRPLPQMFG